MARRQQTAGGMDVMGVLSNVPVALTFLFAVVGWWTAFIGQIVYEHRYSQANGSGSAVGVSWFSIFLQLAVIIALFFVLAQGTLEIYRFQLTAFLSILVVFSVIGTNQGIFGVLGSQLAIGAGWLLLAISNILWLLFITADDETRLAPVFSSYASDVSPNRTRSMMRQSRRTSSALGISNNQGSVTDLHSQHTHTAGSGGYGNNTGGVGAYGNGGPGYGLNGRGMGTPGGGSVHSMGSHGGPAGYAASPTIGSVGGLNNARSATLQQQPQLHQTQQQQAPKLSSTPSAQAIPAQSAPSSIPSSVPASTALAAGSAPTQMQGQSPGQQATNMNTPFEMKASFSYTASPDDPNEISFVKGEILTILDNSGKWFNARKMDGQEGIVPSNYLTFIEA